MDVILGLTVPSPEDVLVRLSHTIMGRPSSLIHPEPHEHQSTQTTFIRGGSLYMEYHGVPS